MDIIISDSEFYAKRDTLNKVKVDSELWVIYYLDEKSGEKWIEERLYPEMQAGGPPQLRKIDRFPWE